MHAWLEWYGTDTGITQDRDGACHAVEVAYYAMVARIAAAKAKGRS